MSVDIRNLNKLELLHRLWYYQKVPRFYAINPNLAPHFNESHATTTAILSKRIGYFCGRPINVDLSASSVDPSDYNREGPTKQFSEVVRDMRIGVPMQQMGEIIDAGFAMLDDAKNVHELYEYIPDFCCVT